MWYGFPGHRTWLFHCVRSGSPVLAQNRGETVTMARTPVEIKMQAMALGADCKGCPLKMCIPVEGYGPVYPSFAVVGESPGFVEKQDGIPFVGPSGSLIRQTIKGVGGEPENIYYTNIVMCHPPMNNTPLGAVLCCLPRLEAELGLLPQNTLIVAAGRMAADRLTGVEGATKGTIHRTEKYGRVMHVLHPAAILKTGMGFSGFAQTIRKAVNGAPPVPEVYHEVCDSVEEALGAIEQAIKRGTVCIDLETDLVDWREHDILCMGVGLSTTEAVIIPAWLLVQPPVQNALRELFASGVEIVGQNIMFDLVYLYHHLGIENVRGDQDTMIAHYILDENAPHGLKEQLASRFDMEDYEQRLVQQFRRNSKTLYSAIPKPLLYEYCAKDVCYNLALWDILKEELLAEKMYGLPYRYPVMASHQTLLHMELRGIPLAEDRLGPLDHDMMVLQDGLQDRANAIAGEPFNPNSPKQVARIIYDVLKLPRVEVRGKTARTTCEEARTLILGMISPNSQGAKFLNALDEIRSLAKLRSSYVKNMWQWLVDGRVHPHYKLTGTITGRLSAADPAIQTIPRTGTGEAGGERWGKAIKSLFVAGDGMMYVLADYSQAELRVAAALSGDEFLTQAYRTGRDIHSETAAEMFGDVFTKIERGYAKNYNFALLYGGTEHSFAAQTGMPLEKCRELVHTMTRRMAGFVAYKERQGELMKRYGEVVYRTGRKRRWPYLSATNMADAEKAAINSPIQGTASDLNLMAMIGMDLWLHENRDTHPHTNLALTVHDSIALIAPEEQALEVGKVLQGIMVDAASEIFPEVPWKVDVEIGPSWGELEKVEL